MIFDKPTTQLVRRRNPVTLSYTESSCNAYDSDEYKLFSIAQIKLGNKNGAWILVHKPSENCLGPALSSKEEIEKFFLFLAKEIDVNSFELYSNMISFDEKIKDEYTFDMFSPILRAYSKYFNSRSPYFKKPV